MITVASLANSRIWVAWEVQERNGDKTKIPYMSPHRPAKANDPETWLTRAQAEAVASNLAKPFGLGGIGIEFYHDGNGLSRGGADLDTCLHADGSIEPWAIEVITRLNSYTEISPSGTGLKVYFCYDTADLEMLRGLDLIGLDKFGRKFSGPGKHAPAIEVHLGNRYFAVTEQHYDGTPLEFRHVDSGDLIWLLRDAGPAFKSNQTETIAKRSERHDESRSAVAFRKGVALYRAGNTFEEMCAALRDDPETAAWWREKGDTNNQRELHRIWAAAEQAHGEPERPPAYSDEALALRFTAAHKGTLRFVAAWGKWLIWDGAVWRFDETLRAFDFSRAVCRRAAAECNEPRVSTALASAKTIAAIERLARADREHAATVDQWDADPWLLNTPGGVVDLRTGQMRTHPPDEHMTKITAVAPAGSCPLWHAFLARITGNDGELHDFLQRVTGYCLTGLTREHALFFGYGTGANGKGTFLNALTGILGAYATVAPMETFTASSTDRHPTDLAMLRGARLVTAQETEEGRRWAESKIKALTGGDPISARFMRQDFFTFTPNFKLFVAGNHKPGLRGVDEAIRRRFNLIPFAITIPAAERDAGLAEKLKAEWPGILAWAIEGCLLWQRIGLKPPAAVTAATECYLEGEDALGLWLAECCRTKSTLYDTAGNLFASWKAWAEAAGESPGSQKRFSQAIEARGFIPDRGHRGVRRFNGIAVKVQGDGW